MKKYLTVIFVFLGCLSVIFGLRLQVVWNGIAAWGLALIFLVIAAFCIKYIPENTQIKECEEKKQ